MECKEMTAPLGCWQKADGSTETVVIHYTYANNLDGDEIVKAVRYTRGDEVALTIPEGDTVVAGACSVASGTYNTTQLDVVTDDSATYPTDTLHSVTYLVQGAGATLSIGGTVTPLVDGGSYSYTATTVIDEEHIITADANTTVSVLTVS